MTLIVCLSSRISPWASTVIFWPRSPLATAVATWAMLRTWLVRFAALKFTMSVTVLRRGCRRVRPHEVPFVGRAAPRAGDARHVGLAAELALGADLAGDARDLVG